MILSSASPSFHVLSASLLILFINCSWPNEVEEIAGKISHAIEIAEGFGLNDTDGDGKGECSTLSHLTALPGLMQDSRVKVRAILGGTKIFVSRRDEWKNIIREKITVETDEMSTNGYYFTGKNISSGDVAKTRQGYEVIIHGERTHWIVLFDRENILFSINGRVQFRQPILYHGYVRSKEIDDERLFDDEEIVLSFFGTILEANDKILSVRGLLLDADP